MQYRQGNLDVAAYPVVVSERKGVDDKVLAAMAVSELVGDRDLDFAVADATETYRVNGEALRRWRDDLEPNAGATAARYPVDFIEVPGGDPAPNPVSVVVVRYDDSDHREARVLPNVIEL